MYFHSIFINCIQIPFRAASARLVGDAQLRTRLHKLKDAIPDGIRQDAVEILCEVEHFLCIKRVVLLESELRSEARVILSLLGRIAT